MSENGNGATTALATQNAAQPAREIVALKGGVLTPSSMSGLWRLSELVAASGMVPKGIQNTEQVFIMLAAGYEIGLSPMQSLANMMVVNNRPSIWGDAALALVHASGQLEDIEETFQRDSKNAIIGATCRVARKGIKTPVVRTFTDEDARAAGLLNKELYQKYKGRMFMFRARSYALRDCFPDVLKGVGVIEEQQDIEAARSVAAEVTARMTGAAELPPSKPVAAGPAAEYVGDDEDNGGSSDGAESNEDAPVLTPRGVDPAKRSGDGAEFIAGLNLDDPPKGGKFKR